MPRRRKQSVQPVPRTSRAGMSEPSVSSGVVAVAADVDKNAPTHIVGIGASAGGLEAVEAFFRRVAPDCGLAFVVIQHLSPDFKSLMDEILARHTTLTIHRAESGLRVERNSIYLITPRKNIIIQRGCLQLVEQTPRPSLNLPIDLFLNSLAEDAGERAIAVILSGTGSDGSRGIRAIKEAGGLVMVQDEETAKFDGMPRAAVATGLADAVLAPEEIARELLRYANYAGFRASNGWQRIAEEATKLNQLVRMLLAATKLDFSSYKTGTLGRRIERRMGLCNLADLDEYLLLLRNSPQEAAVLARDLLIGVTRFFRDLDAWEAFKAGILPRIIADTPPDEPLRFWVTACSTGEEAYTLAMLIEECFLQLQTRRDVKVFATDVDGDAIEVASSGVYPESIAADVGPRRLSQFFISRQNRYEVARPIREKVIFAKHDLLKDPPFTKLHAATCRNFLIYLQPGAQERVLSLLHFALRPGGCLVLGSSESPGELLGAFEPLDEKLRLYRRSASHAVPVVRHPLGVDMSTRLRAAPGTPDRLAQNPLEVPLQRAFDCLIDGYCPPAVLVTDRFDLLHTFGDVSPYVQAPRGAFTADVTKTANESIRLALSTALHRATRDEAPITYREVHLRNSEGARVITLRVQPLAKKEHQQRLFLVMFEEVRREASPAGVEFNLDEQKDTRICDLEVELQQTKENLQATVEELETSNEELQSANEELLASNEELQSTNEELHSVNEELYTVNAEYQTKIEELTTVTNDFDNLLAATDIGVVFLGRDLCIRRFTPAVCEIIQLLDHDIGRPIQQFNASLRGVQLDARIRTVIETGEPFEDQVQTHAGAWYLMRIRPFVDERHSTSGAVLTLVSIDRLVAAEQARRESEQFLQATLDSLAAHIVILDDSGRIAYFNRPWRDHAERAMGKPAADAVGRRYLDYWGPGDTDMAPLTTGIQAVLDGERELFVTDYSRDIDGERHWFTMHVRPFSGAGPRRVCIAHEDITARKRAEEELRHETAEHRASEEAARNTAAQLASIVDSALDGVITISDHGIIQSANRATERLFGYTASELVGANVSILMTPHDAGHHDEYLRKYRATGKAAIIGMGRQVIGQRKDGLTFPLHLAVTEFYRGEQRMFSGVLRDITQEVQRFEALRRTAERLEAVNRDVEQFATVAAHDLQEPMRTVHGYCQLLRDRLDQRLDDTDRRHFDRVDAAISHLQGMIDGLRRYAQLTPEDLATESCDMNEVMQSVFEQLSQLIRESGASIECPALPSVNGNRQLLQHVFQNLVDNAIKYRSPTPPQITVSAKQQDATWVLGVHDNGAGIDPIHHERVFQVFRRVNPPKDCAGSGVGLAIAKRIVDKHGGRIWVESQLGHGSSFFVELPAR